MIVHVFFPTNKRLELLLQCSWYSIVRTTELSTTVPLKRLVPDGDRGQRRERSAGAQTRAPEEL